MRVLILGLGQFPQGSGVAAALYFAKKKDEVIVTDLKDATALRDNVNQLKKFMNVRLRLGREDVKDLDGVSLVVRNPRVRDDNPIIREAKKRGITIESDVSLFLRQCPAAVIGVTGTRGKSTTTALLAEMLKAWKKKKVWVGGNILVSPLTFMRRVKADDLVVLELSSWQLEATGAAGLSPHIALWTNLMRDHLNTYPDMAAYAEAKAQIFRHQKPDDVVLLPNDKTFNAYAQGAPGRVTRFGKATSPEAKLVKSVKMKLEGAHNIDNAMAATAVALEIGVPTSVIKKVLRTFEGLPNRQEVIRIVGGVSYVNDTTSTTPDATIAALKRFVGKGTIHLIFGGADKELEFDEVAKEIKKKKVNVTVLSGTAEKKIEQAFTKGGVSFAKAESLFDALSQILKNVKKGDTVLLSPGCASFGMFKNEFDRGEQFRELVKKVK
jgi:UDP-N-acetylmuramoylalanine--D-glutamate ligase